MNPNNSKPEAGWRVLLHRLVGSFVILNPQVKIRWRARSRASATNQSKMPEQHSGTDRAAGVEAHGARPPATSTNSQQPEGVGRRNIAACLLMAVAARCAAMTQLLTRLAKRMGPPRPRTPTRVLAHRLKVSPLLARALLANPETMGHREKLIARARTMNPDQLQAMEDVSWALSSANRY
jgi:hypothetical protein